VIDTVAPRPVSWAMSVAALVPALRPVALTRKARVATWETVDQRVAWCDEALTIDPSTTGASVQRARLVRDRDPAEAERTLLRAWALAGASGRTAIAADMGVDPATVFTNDRLATELRAIAGLIGGATDVRRRTLLVAALMRAGHPDLAAFTLDELRYPPISSSIALKLVTALHRRGEMRRPLEVAEAYRDSRSPRLEVFIAARRRELEILQGRMQVSYPRFEYRPGTSTRSIYLLHNSLPHQSGGYATRTHGLLTALDRLGQPTVGVTRPGFPAKRGVFQQADVAPMDVIDGVPYRRLIGPVPSMPRVDLQGFTRTYVDMLRPIMDEYRPALLHAASNWWNGLAATQGAAAAGIPSVYEVRGLWEVTRWSRQPEWGASETFQLDARYEAEVAMAADRVITITTALKQEMVRRGVEESKISIVPNAVDVERFSKVERDPAVAAALGFEGSVVIGFAGSITFYEGLDDLLHAAAMLRGNTKVPFGLLFVGDGAVKADLEQLAVELGVDDLCRFVGRVPHHDVEKYLGIMDITPFPRKPLPVCEMVSPLKPLESMASGVSVMVSSVDALLEMVDFGACGAVFRKGDNEDFARVLGQMIDDPEMRRSYVEHARGWVAENRSWLAVARTVADLYDELAPRR
jgi:glycosyltransferase involved in cell wall biosynthesis